MEEPQEPEAPTEPENEPSPTILILAEGKLYTANEAPLCIPRNETVQPLYFQSRIIMFCLPIPTLINL